MTTPLQDHFVARARHLEAIEATHGDDLSPLAWHILDNAYESTLREAAGVSAACYEAVWATLFPDVETRTIMRSLRGMYMEGGNG